MELNDGDDEIVRLRTRGWSTKTIAFWLGETPQYVSAVLYAKRIATPPKEVSRLGNREGRTLIIQRSLDRLRTARNPADDDESQAIRDRILFSKSTEGL